MSTQPLKDCKRIAKKGVYLLHFLQPIPPDPNAKHHATHYIGYANDIPARIVVHRTGSDAKIMAAVLGYGIDFVVARTWYGKTRKFERQLKNQHNHARYCPICKKLAKERGTE